MAWKRQQVGGYWRVWTCGDWSIELQSAYELYHLATYVKTLATLEEAKAHATGEMRLRGELPKRGRPRSAGRCADCGAPPAHQQR